MLDRPERSQEPESRADPVEGGGSGTAPLSRLALPPELDASRPIYCNCKGAHTHEYEDMCERCLGEVLDRMEGMSNGLILPESQKDHIRGIVIGIIVKRAEANPHYFDGVAEMLAGMIPRG